MNNTFEDCREQTPCGALSMYTVDNRTDFITYQTFGTAVPPKLTANKCQRCAWTSFCQKYKELDRAVKSGETIEVLRVLGGDIK